MTDVDTGPIAFGTDGWRATLEEFTEPRVRAVGRAVADYLDEEGVAGAVGVCYDARESSRGFAEALAEVLADAGREVLLADRDRPTPLLAYAIVDRDLAGGLMVTASHNPPEYNGVKFVPADGAPATPAVTDRIESLLDAPGAGAADAADAPDGDGSGDGAGSVREADFREPHAAHALELVGSYAGGVVDPGDGDAADPDVDVDDSGEGDADDSGGVNADDAGDDTDDSGNAADGDATDAGAGVDLSGLTVAYDAMHGSGRDTTDALLRAAGADVTRLRCGRDPEFGGTPPEPAPEHLTDLVARVREGPADLGIANDGDADRLAVVTPDRGFLDENLFFAALYDYLLETAAGPAVRTVSTTFLIDRVAGAHGESVVETAVGFKYVARAMAEADALVGGEESGGFTVRGHVREKDGVLMALLAAAMEAAEPLDDRVARLLDAHGTVHQDKVSVDCPDDRKAAVVDALGDRVPESVAGEPVAEVVETDGFKLLLADGSWLLVRPSGTEPKMRVYAEATDPDRVGELLAAGRDLVEPLV